jgi:superfamily II DNA or RNA helicase
MSYSDFIRGKSQWGEGCGFDPDSLPDWLYDFQRHLVEWSLRQGRSAIFADCGMGKTAMQLAWADTIIRRENKPVLIVTPLAVGAQTIAEAERFGIEAKRSRNGVFDGTACVWVTNYEQMAKLDPSKFAGVVCDESSAIKDFKSERKGIVVDFMRTMQYRLLCTATAAPNDFWELGTSSEALGLLGFRDMITKFFRMTDNISKRFAGDQMWAPKYRFRGHAEKPFWSWVCSWARSMKMPSDLGFDDSRFILPELIEQQIVVRSEKLREGFLFSIPAQGMREEREERRRTLTERCEKAAELMTEHDRPAAMWCSLNDEGNLLEKLIPDCVQVSGSMNDDEKEEALMAFSSGEIKRIVTKPVIAAWGLNWQHCSDVVAFPTHSFEQYYQLRARFYRFGQKRNVTVTSVCSEGESNILKNLQRKQAQTERMFRELVAHMQDSMRIVTQDSYPNQEQVPSWLSSNK